MKHTYTLPIAIVAALFLLLAGCAKEYSFEGNGNLPATQQRRCINCAYLPLCDSSEFTYLIDTTGTGGDTATGVVQLLNDTLIGGKTFAKVSGFAAFNTGLLYNCDDQEYRMMLTLAQFGLNADSLRALINQLPPNPQFPINPASIQIPDRYAATILKANAPQGATWIDTLTRFNVTFQPSGIPIPLSIPIYIGIEYKLLQKNVSYSVLGNNYTNVMYVQGKPTYGIAGALPIPLPITLPPFPGDFRIDFRLSRDVGLIEMAAANGPDPLLSARLLRYRL